MAVIKEVTTTAYRLTDVKRGDVFRVLAEMHAYPVGHLLVVEKADGHAATFVSLLNGGSYGSISWLESEINAGNIKYLGTVANALNFK